MKKFVQQAKLEFGLGEGNFVDLVGWVFMCISEFSDV
jgi:hypothetical protein